MALNRQPTTPPPNNSAFGKFDASQIGAGKNFREGSYAKARGGLKGQLSKMRRAGARSSTANISQKNMRQMHDIMAKRLRGKATGSTMTSKDIRKMSSEAYRLMKDPNADFSKEDYKDFKKILKQFNEPTTKTRAQADPLPAREQRTNAVNPVNQEKAQALARPAGMAKPVMPKNDQPTFAAGGSMRVKDLKRVGYDTPLKDKPPLEKEPEKPTIPKASDAIDLMID